MRCTHCRIESKNLRAYARANELSVRGAAAETFYLCPACRVLNALHPSFRPLDGFGADSGRTRAAPLPDFASPPARTPVPAESPNAWHPSP